MKLQNDKFIGTIISKNKVIFKGKDGVIYEKKIKEKNNKVVADNYVKGVNVNISCNNILGEYATVEGSNKPYYNKLLLTFIIILLIVFALLSFFTFGLVVLGLSKNILLAVLSLLLLIVTEVVLVVYIIYICTKKVTKCYKNYTEIVSGEIINYSRREYVHDSEYIKHCSYDVMYKYKTKEGDIIHSLVQLGGADAQLLYKDYKLKQKVLVCYDPNNCCCSCLKDEYDCALLHKKFVKNSFVWNTSIGIITSIETKCIDDEIEDYLKEYYLVDYIKCEYTYSGTKYKMYSLFSVPHDRFKLGEEITIFINQDDGEIFFCDINTKYSKSDKYEY